MANDKLEEILKQGIYGRAEIRPEERKLFLTTIAERIYLYLTHSQVRNRGFYPEAETIMKDKKNAHLYINGRLNYQFYSNYIQLANNHSIPFTIINDGHDTPVGIVLAADHAINQEADMYIEDELYQDDMK